MLRWRRARPGEKANLGVFFVWKKGKTAQRIIFGTRLCNLQFEDAPSTRLPTAGCMARLECTGDDFWMAQGDISNAFYAVELEDGLSDYFTLRPLPASSIGLTSLDGEALGPSDLGCT